MATAGTPPGDPPNQGSGSFIFSDQFWKVAWRLTILFLLVFAVVAAGWAIYNWQITTTDVGEGNFVRGLITVVILCGILILVAIVVLTALFAESTPPSADETVLKRVTAVREVLAPLFGIFGTIIGFYFGSQTAERAADLERGRGTPPKQAGPATPGVDTKGRDLPVPSQAPAVQPVEKAKTESQQKDQPR